MPASATEQDIRAALLQHWAASDANDFPTEHQIYCDDAILDYPQSGERVRGRANIQASRSKQPSEKRFHVRRILGSGDLWVTEYIITYDEKPNYTVSIMHSGTARLPMKRNISVNRLRQALRDPASWNRLVRRPPSPNSYPTWL